MNFTKKHADVCCIAVIVLSNDLTCTTTSPLISTKVNVARSQIRIFTKNIKSRHNYSILKAKSLPGRHF